MWILAVLVALSTPAAETLRVKAHIAGAEAQLRAADVSALSPVQRARRAWLIEELAEYRRRGVFPRNLDLAERTPFFIDDRGVRCAMAHLIEISGGGELVARVAATANNAYVHDLAADPALRAWLEANGMTVDEAARVQPSYDHQTPVGAWCRESRMCASDHCLIAPEDPETGYCTQPCDPGTACPIGASLNVEMACEAVGEAHACVYPEGTGTIGSSCDPETLSPCPELCHARDGDGICTRFCTTSEECPADFACSPVGGPQDGQVCTPKASGGCSSTGGTPSALLAAMLLLLARRQRPSRSRVRPT